MLCVVRNMKELRFGALMGVYSEANRENGAAAFPEETPERQEMLAEQDFYQYLRECFFTTPGAFYCIWEENGKYVSALRLEPYRDGLLLAALETAPEHRRKGYAAKLVMAVLAYVGERKVYSHVSKKNMASLSVHEKCGFSVMADYAVYADGSVLTGACTLCR